MKELVYVFCEEYNDKAKFIVQRLKRFHDEIEVVTASTLWKFDTVSGAYILLVDPDEMPQELLEEVVLRVNQTYDPARTLVGMVSAQYGCT